MVGGNRMKTTQITRHGKKVDFHDFTEDERDKALEVLDRLEGMTRSLLMLTNSQQMNTESPTNG